MVNLRQLYDLQELDWEMGRFQAEITLVEARLQDQSALLKVRAEVAEGEEKLHQLRRQQVSQSQAAQEWQSKARSLEQRLYGGSIRNPREMESLQAELQFAKTHAREEEDNLLNLMIALEEREERLARSRQDLVHAEQLWTETQAALTQQQATLTQRLQTLQAKRHQVTSSIAPNLMVQYEQVRKSKQGQAVARVERGMCMGCRLTLPAIDLQRVRSAQEPVTCGTCGRILFMG